MGEEKNLCNSPFMLTLIKTEWSIFKLAQRSYVPRSNTLKDAKWE